VKAGAAGLYHVTNAGDCTWYEFAREIFARSGLKPDLTAVASSERQAAARRPRYSVLGSLHHGEKGLPIPRHWSDALAAYLVDRNSDPA